TADLRILGYAMEPWSRARFQSHIGKALRNFSEDYDARSAAAFVRQLDYISGQLTPEDLARIAGHLSPGTLFYLALPPP
ncbi:glucose-6-phosphate dehydrogenase, partial [mine drainage metagenome]